MSKGKKKAPRRSRSSSPTKKPELKRYIVRKYVMARSAAEAITKSRRLKPDDVWIDDTWKTEPKQFESAIGFTSPTESDAWGW